MAVTVNTPEKDELVHLVKFDPESELHVAELKRQRIICGWNEDLVEGWCNKARRGLKGLVWVMRSSTPAAQAYFAAKPLPELEKLNLTNDPEARSPRPISENFRPIGHASLDWEDMLNDETLASKKLGNITFTSFFLLLSQQGLGLGSLVMDLLEAMAKTPEYGAKYITLTTLDGDLARDPAWWERTLGLAFDPSKRINEEWYARRGYEVLRKNVPRYPELHKKTGEQVILNAVYMRKNL
ncbi:BQ5605_C002g01728 [Microbotryum silenes-dioicae]|uniref:BQ5605_C002g01728 protein n=1 Tax=Microbotryum silenes-dioicae TaxID=796604 RepID=A0A2X0P2B9_9BASI|nr:BQ5605_C002g01728 [Microbotryum silenes-dioicae]